MADLEAIFKVVDQLTPGEKQQLVEYIQQQEAVTQPRKTRTLDLHAGAMLMSEDFDDDLSDSFWLGEA